MIELLKKLHRRWIRPWAWGDSPMEIQRAILDEIETKVVALGGGRKLFPYDRLRLHLLAVDPEQRAILDSAAKGGWDLERSIRDSLEGVGCPAPSSLELAVEITGEADPAFGDRRFFVEYGQSPEVKAPAGRPSLELSVTRGTAAEEVYRTSASRIYIGRLVEVFDQQGRLERRNEVAFADEGEVNATVSRKHASIRYDEGSRAYFLRDDYSAAGTRIFRDGRPVEVGSHRQGVQLRDGDEVSFGRAQVVVRMLGGE